MGLLPALAWDSHVSGLLAAEGALRHAQRGGVVHSLFLGVVMRL